MPALSLCFSKRLKEGVLLPYPHEVQSGDSMARAQRPTCPPRKGMDCSGEGSLCCCRWGRHSCLLEAITWNSLYPRVKPDTLQLRADPWWFRKVRKQKATASFLVWQPVIWWCSSKYEYWESFQQHHPGLAYSRPLLTLSPFLLDYQEIASLIGSDAPRKGNFRDYVTVWC